MVPSVLDLAICSTPSVCSLLPRNAENRRNSKQRHNTHTTRTNNPTMAALARDDEKVTNEELRAQVRRLEAALQGAGKEKEWIKKKNKTRPPASCPPNHSPLPPPPPPAIIVSTVMAGARVYVSSSGASPSSLVKRCHCRGETSAIAPGTKGSPGPASSANGGAAPGRETHILPLPPVQ